MKSMKYCLSFFFFTRLVPPDPMCTALSEVSGKSEYKTLKYLTRLYGKIHGVGGGGGCVCVCVLMNRLYVLSLFFITGTFNFFFSIVAV